MGPEGGRRRAAALCAAALAALAAFGLVVASARSRPRLPVLATLPGFTLTDQHGRPVTDAALRGHPYVADFIFTTCAGTCPAMTSRMARLQKDLPHGTRLISFTVDPAHDTPEILAAYAKDFHAGPAWLFVSGPKDALYSLATQGFRLEAFEAPAGATGGGDGPFLHSSRLVLVDGHGRVRGYYDSQDEAVVGRLAADLRGLSAAE